MEFKTLANRGLRWVRNNWDKFNFDSSMQRHGGLWDIDKKTKLVHTFIAGYKSPNIFCIDLGNGSYEFIDGKQRLGTVKEFLNDEFALSEVIEDEPATKGIELKELSGKRFSELSKEIQDIILDYSFNYIAISDATEEEIEEQMFRLNDSTPMSSIEKLRIVVGQKIRDFLSTVSKHEFISQQIRFSPTDRKRFNDELMVLEIFAIVMDKDFDHSHGEIKKFALELKENMPEDEKEKLMKVLDYLADAFRDSVVYNKGYVPQLKKVHIAGIVKCAMEAIEDNVKPEEFSSIVLTFLKNQDDLRKEHRKNNNVDIGKYNEACDSGSNKFANITIRTDELIFYYKEQIEVNKFDEINDEMNVASGI
jgi:hypothetical protein